MQTAKDIMSDSVITVTPDTDITSAARLLLENHINGIPVVAPSGKVVGILCQSDLVAQQKKISLAEELPKLHCISKEKHERRKNKRNNQ